jgi:CheY-like chemotaxis protein
LELREKQVRCSREKVLFLTYVRFAGIFKPDILSKKNSFLPGERIGFSNSAKPDSFLKIPITDLAVDMQNYEKKRNNLRPGVLVVEQNKSLQLILQNVLRENFRVFLCPTLTDSLSFLRNEPFPSLILYDLNAEPRQGLKALSFFRENQLFRKIPLIPIVDREEEFSKTNKQLLSQWEIKEEDVVRKPFDPLMLSRRITGLLNQTDQ